jgi:hypothetical protein
MNLVLLDDCVAIDRHYLWCLLKSLRYLKSCEARTDIL